MHRFGQSEALTAGILAGFRNVGLGYALVGETIGHQLAVYVGVSMLPMFITPVIIRVVYANRQEALLNRQRASTGGAIDALDDVDAKGQPA
jgi:hypothetical protein